MRRDQHLGQLHPSMLQLAQQEVGVVSIQQHLPQTLISDEMEDLRRRKGGGGGGREGEKEGGREGDERQQSREQLV